MNIRNPRLDDLQQCHVLRLRALREDPTAFGSSYEEEALRPLPFFAEHLGPGSDRTLIGAFVEDALVGMVGLSREGGTKERHRACIRSMFVAPEHRGKGVGRRLLAQALSTASGMPGLRQIGLTVTAGNLAAVSLYEVFGFTLYGRAPEALLVHGAYHDEILMVKRATGALSLLSA